MDTQFLEEGVIGRHGPIKLHGPEGFAGMRAAGRCAAEILDALVPHVVAGVTTQELDDFVFAEMRARGAIPATLGYRGYTKSCCTSINHVICHGIPGDRALKDGDIVNIDVTPILDGWHGDTSRMYLVGDVGIKASQARPDHLRMPDARHRGRRGPATGSATSPTPSRAMPRGIAIRWSAISAATASAGSSTTRPRWSMPAAPAPARSFGPACSSPSSR